MNFINHEKEQLTFPVAIVCSRFNKPITDKLLEGALRRLHERDFNANQIDVISVPGAVEIPLTALKLSQTQKYKAIITLGCVIRGETSHYDYVCSQVSQGCQQVALQTGLPVVFGILTTENRAQAEDRIGGAHGHKGEEAADVAIEMVSLYGAI